MKVNKTYIIIVVVLIIFSFTVIINSHDNKQSTLKEILHPDSMYLIFRYSVSYCGDCIHEICTKLVQLRDSIPCVNIIIIVSGGTFREMKVKMYPYKDVFPIFLMLNNDLDLPADKSNVPYMFFINDTKTTKHTLVIDPNSLDLLQEYIQTLSKKYCNY